MKRISKKIMLEYHIHGRDNAINEEDYKFHCAEIEKLTNGAKNETCNSNR